MLTLCSLRHLDVLLGERFRLNGEVWCAIQARRDFDVLKSIRLADTSALAGSWLQDFN